METEQISTVIPYALILKIQAHVNNRLDKCKPDHNCYISYSPDGQAKNYIDHQKYDFSPKEIL